ncbi:MAG: hypothetical protein ACR2JS_09715 [Candidatus Nanopelagicales bacterium]
MSAINHVWENPVKIQSREEIIEDKLRHVVGRLERMERVGEKDYLQLNPVEATALSIVLKEKIAELTMNRYSTEREQRELAMAHQAQLFAQRGGGMAQAIQSGQVYAVSVGGGGSGGGQGGNNGSGYYPPPSGKPVKKPWWKP